MEEEGSSSSPDIRSRERLRRSYVEGMKLRAAERRSGTEIELLFLLLFQTMVADDLQIYLFLIQTMVVDSLILMKSVLLWIGFEVVLEAYF